MLWLSLFRYVIANDLSSSAIAAMRRNVELNGLGGEEDAAADAGAGSFKLKLGKVRINEGDARYNSKFTASKLRLTFAEGH